MEMPKIGKSCWKKSGDETRRKGVKREVNFLGISNKKRHFLDVRGRKNDS